MFASIARASASAASAGETAARQQPASSNILLTWDLMKIFHLTLGEPPKEASSTPE